MKFSIIVPTHNAENYIHHALNSISGQTYKDYELIVVCDACTDGTEEIARTYTDNVILENFHNDGLARSKGLDVAKGDWILFMDDDDWWLHEYVLQQLAERVGKENEDILAFSFIFKGIKYASPLSNGGQLYPAVWNKCWRRSFIGDTRFPNVHSVSDWYFWLTMLDKNPKIATWDMPMYYYNYMRVGSITEIDSRR